MNNDTLKTEFKTEFKQHGIRLKDIEENKTKLYSDIAFIFDRNVQYVARWYYRKDYLTFARIEKNDIPDNIDDINFDINNVDSASFLNNKQEMSQPNIPKIVDAISKNYKEYLRQRGIVSRLISKFINENN